MAVDIRTRLAALLGVTVAVMSFNHPLFNLGVLALLLVWLFAQRGQTPLAGLGKLLRPLVPIMAIVAIFASFTTPTRIITEPGHLVELWSWGPLRFTVGGALMGVTYLLRMTTMVTATWGLLAGLSLDDVLELAAHWKLPTSVSIMISTAVAAIPTLTRRREQIQQSQQARGARSDTLARRWAATVATMVPLMTSALLSAQNLAVALSVRGYGAHRTMTALGELRCTRRDLIAAVGWLLLGLAALVTRVAFGLGRL